MALLQRWSSVVCAGILTIVFASHCDEGLKPPPVPPQTSISGTVRYVGGTASWPQARDSVWTVRVVGFRQFPPMDLIADILQGRAYFTPQALALDSTLPLYADSSRYSLILPEEPPARIEYLCVAMLVDTAKILTAAGWRVIGVYTGANGSVSAPAQIPVVYGRDTEANITVDFRNPPPQPF